MLTHMGLRQLSSGQLWDKTVQKRNIISLRKYKCYFNKLKCYQTVYRFLKTCQVLYLNIDKYVVKGQLMAKNGLTLKLFESYDKIGSKTFEIST